MKQTIKNLVASILMTALWSGVTWAIASISGLKFEQVAPVVITFTMFTVIFSTRV